MDGFWVVLSKTLRVLCCENLPKILKFRILWICRDLRILTEKELLGEVKQLDRKAAKLSAAFSEESFKL